MSSKIFHFGLNDEFKMQPLLEAMIDLLEFRPIIKQINSRMDDKN